MNAVELIAALLEAEELDWEPDPSDADDLSNQSKSYCDLEELYVNGQLPDKNGHWTTRIEDTSFKTLAQAERSLVAHLRAYRKKWGNDIIEPAFSWPYMYQSGRIIAEIATYCDTTSPPKIKRFKFTEEGFVPFNEG